MPMTPGGLPYPANTDFVTDGNEAIENLAEAIEDGLTLHGPLKLSTFQLGTNGPDMWAGSGVPSNSYGNLGDFYFRSDAPDTPSARIYVRGAAGWGPIV